MTLAPRADWGLGAGRWLAAVAALLVATHNQKPQTCGQPHRGYLKGPLQSHVGYLKGPLQSHLGHLALTWIHPLASIMASPQSMVKMMDATKLTCPLHNKQALLSHLQVRVRIGHKKKQLRCRRTGLWF